MSRKFPGRVTVLSWKSAGLMYSCILVASVQCYGRHTTDEEAGDEQRVSYRH